MPAEFARIGPHKLRRADITLASRDPASGSVEFFVRGGGPLCVRAGRAEHPAAVALYESIEADDPAAPPALLPREGGAD